MCHSHDRIFGGADRPERPPITRGEWEQSDGHSTPYIEARPSTEPHGAIMLAVDAIGMSPFYEDVARELAASGYVVVAPDYFSRMTPLTSDDPAERRARRKNQMDDVRVLADMEEFCDLLDRHIAPGLPVFAFGFCLGGMFSLSLAAQCKLVKGVVAYYGFVQGQAGRSLVDTPPAIDLAEELDVPMLLHWGTADSEAYVADAVAQFVNATTSAGGSPDVQTYEGATHGFLKAIDSEEDSPNQRAARASWPATLEFLAKESASPRARATAG